MDINEKINILSHLARKAVSNSAAQQAIQKECSKITSTLQSEIQYDNISEQLELLGTIAYQVSDEVVNTVQNLLDRLKNIELTYLEIPGYPSERLREYQNNYKLMIKALEVLEHIRYHQPAEILDVFFEYSCHEQDNVAKQAEHGIEKLSGYDLDIFYGDGKDWSGLGWQPQEKVLEKIYSFDKEQKIKYFTAIIIACEQILTPTITGTSSTYKAVTWRTGAIPAIDGVKKIREKALEELISLFKLANNIDQKRTVLNAIETATRTPHMGDYSDATLAMIVENSLAVMEFLKSIAVSNDMQLMQKVEHDAYWLLYHKGKLDESIHKVALEIRDVLYADKEYQKFRTLIGFESIFHDWEKGAKERDDFESERNFREAEALKLSKSIDASSYDEWKARIISYASIQSNDLATFPYFGKFLEYFGENSPGLALQLLSEISDQLGNFIIAILCGISKTDNKEDAFSLIDRWIDEEKYLFSLARFFEFSAELNEDLVNKILEKASSITDLNTLNQIILSVSESYSNDNKDLIKKFILPVIEILTEYKNSDWVFGFWFRKQRGDIIGNMDVAEYKTILDNLYWLQQIDYHAEEILCVIANQSPELVIRFFCKRLSKEKSEDESGRYEAIPFNFYKLSEPLSKHPSSIVDAVLDIYDGNYGMFVYQGARLLKNIFPSFPAEFQEKLLAVMQSKEEDDFLFVMAILRNYDGDPIIHNVCKEFIKILPDGSKLENELITILESTGVVSGEYGFVEAYKLKIEEIQSWLQDDNSKVKDFTKNYITGLEKHIEYEKKRSDENIMLHKHQHGSGEE